MRTLTSACAVTAAAATSLLLGPAAYATPPGDTGDNGTVKIHDVATDEELRKNEPHVCTFYIDAFGYDGDQQATWQIVEMPPTGTKDKEADSGSLTLDSEGHGTTTERSLPEGHYKLNFNFSGEKGSAKHKVFWTECDDEGQSDVSDTPPATSDEQGDEPDDEPSEIPTGESSESSDVSANGSTAPSPAPNGGGDLAETGASVGIPAAIAALLLGAGAFLVRRRRAQQH